MTGLTHFVSLHGDDGYLSDVDIDLVRSRQAAIAPGDVVWLRVPDDLVAFAPGVGESLGLWLAEAGNVRLRGGGLLRRRLWDQICAAAWQCQLSGASSA